MARRRVAARPSVVLLACAALCGSPTAQEQAEGRPYARLSVPSVAGCGYATLRGRDVIWHHARGEVAKDWAGEVTGKAPRADERVVVTHRGPGSVRVVQQPRRANDFTTILVVPAPEVSWNRAGDDWRLAHEPRARHEIELRLVPEPAWHAAQAPAGAEDAWRRIGRLERSGRNGGKEELREALDRYEELALATTDADARRTILARYADVHRNVRFEPTAADLAKVDALLDEQVRATYGDEGAVRAGKYVMLLWPRDFVEHPSVPGFLAMLDAAYASLVELTGQNPCDVYGHRLCFFFMPAGAAWFNHHIGMGRAEFGEYPPFDTVYFHEMGHDFFKYPTDLVAPEPSWGEGMASFAQLRALDFIGFDRAGLFAIWAEGERRMNEHPKDRAHLSDKGVYFKGAYLFSSFGAAPDRAKETIAWDWTAFRRLLDRFRELGHAPRSRTDRYRHWAALIADVFGADVHERLAELGYPVSADDRSVAHEREVVLPALADARARMENGDLRGAERVLDRLARAKEHRLRADVQKARLDVQLRRGNEREAKRTAAELGFLRHWWIHGALEGPDSDAIEDVPGFEAAYLGAGVTHSVSGRDVWTVERSLGTCVQGGAFRAHEVAAVDGTLDLRAVLANSGAEPATTYAVTVIESEEARTVELRFGHDDDAAVFLNGAPVLPRLGFTGVSFDAYALPLELRAGANVLMIKVVNRGGGWGLVARLAGDDGFAARGVTSRWPRACDDAPDRAPKVLWQLGERDFDYRDLGWCPTDEWQRRFTAPVRVRPADTTPAAWSALHPGPNDRWAGSRTHTFVLETELDASARTRAHELRIWTVGQNGWTPPLLRIDVNGLVAEHRLPGSPDTVLRDPTQGTPTALHLRLPPGTLTRGENRIALTIPDGSWILYDALALVAF